MPPEVAPSPQKKPKEPSLMKNLLLAGALHAGIGLGARTGPIVLREVREVASSIQEKIAQTFEEHEIAQARSEMLDTARRAQAEHRPWAGRFLIQSWFIEKRAAHEPHNDQRDIQEKYNRLLAQLRTKLQNTPRTPETIQRALGEVLDGYDYWPSNEGHMTQFLREHGGSCATVGPLVAALLNDLSIPGVGLRIIAANPQDEVPVGHIEATIRIPTTQGTQEYGLQRGRRMGTNGVHVWAADLLQYYQPGSSQLHFPAPQTEEERRPDPAGGPTLTPFQEGSVNTSLREAGPSNMSSELSPERAAQLIATMENRVSSVISNTQFRQPNLILGSIQTDKPSQTLTPVGILSGYTTFDWQFATILTQELLQTARAIKQVGGSPQADRLSIIYAALGEEFELLRQKAAGAMRNSASLEFESRRDQFFRQSDEQLRQAHLLEYHPLDTSLRTILEGTSLARRTYFERTVAALRVTTSLLMQEQLFSNFFFLLPAVQEPDLRRTIMQKIDQLSANPLHHALLINRAIQHLERTDANSVNAEAQGDHPLVEQIHSVAALRVADGMNIPNIESSHSKEEFEARLQDVLHRIRPGAGYDPSFTLSVILFITEYASEANVHDETGVKDGIYYTGLRADLTNAQQAVRLLGWYEQDSRFPAGYITNEIQRLQTTIQSLEHALVGAPDEAQMPTPPLAADSGAIVSNRPR